MATRPRGGKQGAAARTARAGTVQRVELGERSYEIRTGFETLPLSKGNRT